MRIVGAGITLRCAPAIVGMRVSKRPIASVKAALRYRCNRFEQKRSVKKIQKQGKGPEVTRSRK